MIDFDTLSRPAARWARAHYKVIGATLHSAKMVDVDRAEFELSYANGRTGRERVWFDEDGKAGCVQQEPLGDAV